MVCSYQRDNNMKPEQDPIQEICLRAASLPGVSMGTSCNQTAYMVGKGKFLFIGPGPKGVGFKAMFKLKSSMSEALALSEETPDRIEVGTTGWVTARFSAQAPMPAALWEKWLLESYELTAGKAK